MELIVINSYGPMASTVISSVIEKFGYINLPIRKRKLEEYVIDKRKIDDTYFKDRTIHVLKNLSNLNSIGGINVIDRNKNKLEKKINLNLIQSDLDNFYNKKYTSLEEMYFDSMLIANKATIYKKKTNTIRGSIELATYIEQNDNKEVFRLYKKKFKKVKFINLDREFTSWLNSLLSQKLFERNRSYLPKIVKLFAFVPEAICPATFTPFKPRVCPVTRCLPDHVVVETEVVVRDVELIGSVIAENLSA